MQLGELQREHQRLRQAGVSVFAVSTDPPDVSQPLQKRLGDTVTVLSDEAGGLLDALGVRHRDGVPWYDRLLLGARRGDIAFPAALLVDASGRVRFAHRSQRVDDRPSPEALLGAAIGT